MVDDPVAFFGRPLTSPVKGFHVLNARGDGSLRWMFNYLGRDAKAYRNSMQREVVEFERLLSSRGVHYGSLKSALVPTREGRQIALIFDWSASGRGSYGYEYSKAWLPSLRRTAHTSVKHGDLLRSERPDDHLQFALRPSRVTHQLDWELQYAVYFSNLTRADIQTMHESLQALPAYNGYIDATFAGPVRNYFARTLTGLGVFSAGTVLLDHGLDDPFVSNRNEIGYPFEDFGINVVSLVDGYYVPFLEYKIESDVESSHEIDAALTLAAVTGEIIDIESVEIHVPPDKLDRYLLVDESKLRLMRSIGLEDVTPEELEDVVRDNLLRSYVYDLRVAPDGAAVFSVSAEFEKPEGDMTKRLLALKYDPAESRIALVTMY
ncbi:hypothetical protein [Agromyces aerolatus]|uniref:hypothetical protein n=1 Tax=Agromyces sp. LY-1074 TaxID=3074080 RepID=UPI00285E3364|nr:MULTISPECIES: hypothetical protein [unclassified Agromyces]MDR5699960.1 hypothetical protein [Agromyces sp. LY-1074]MDR5706228.1 hypothetical protein [Agromyces sp. LY-1358]